MMLHFRRSIFKVFKIILGCYYYCSWDIPMLMALMLRANKLLAMAKDTNDLHFIIVGEVFFRHISCSIVLQFFWGCFKNIYPPINLEYRPLKVMKPFILGFEPSSTYTLTRSWWRLTLKIFLITFFELLLFFIIVMSWGLLRALSLLPSYFMVHILLFINSMGNMWKGSPLLNHFQAWSKVTP
jgi:hypothetical protein